MSIKEVANSHLWAKINNVPTSNNDKNSNIPIIDLLAPNVVELMGHECKTWGIFHLARRLFALPAEQKVKVLRSTNGATNHGIT
uniref:Uncharacterized protein n=1 Tax=Solanum lycopersicum TaxID=4081 RepID=A0A3Q7EEM5_SOLLC